MRNYFKTPNGELFFFADTVPESIEGAFVAALVVSDEQVPSIYQPAQVAGPWDACPVVGHRSRTEILRDLSTETDEETLAGLAEELASVEATFRNVGRYAPLQVAA